MTKAFFNWSGGKDSALALWKILQDKKLKIEYLLTSINRTHDRVSMHGVRRELLETQAASIQIPLATVELPAEPSMQEYENEMMKKVNWLKDQGITKGIFGDIFLEDLRIYRETKLATAGIECVFPIWKKNTSDLVHEFIHAGFKAIVVCVNEKFLDKSFCGRIINESFCRDIPADVDACGENGEFHSFVYDGPIFSHPVRFRKGEVVYKQYKAPETLDGISENPGFYFCDLLA
jgi:uncharacterized protein (TIGR00290 family)